MASSSAKSASPEWEVVWKGAGDLFINAGGEVAAAPSPAGKELGRWRQARATGL
jgi:hypothetical protein